MSAPPSDIPQKNKAWEEKLKGKDMGSADIKQQLPQKHRIVGPNTMVTRDFVEDRLNVHVDAEGKCTHCTHG
ncbi:hypothetical protein FN846DRAFT_905787 [Sphaerosporella brunnea]|uniref:Uncharacterized protein n=1 Tax=Sphaerosporella brunnea TaxID=1250544 RepID=A0A5J5F0L5_9PEZI|nr:hypothetical protein FN846DRAFT_905787 [Sphaerosporella brunnea]